MYEGQKNTEMAAIAGQLDIRKGSNFLNSVPPRSGGINQYPGDRMGLTPEQVQDYIKRQKRCLGQAFTLASGSNQEQAIQLPGTARLLLGWAFTPVGLGANPLTGNARIVLNNEVLVENVYVGFYGADFTDEEYYFIPRPLSGNDNFSISVNNVVDAYTLQAIFYYL